MQHLLKWKLWNFISNSHTIIQEKVSFACIVELTRMLHKCFVFSSSSLILIFANLVFRLANYSFESFKNKKIAIVDSQEYENDYLSWLTWLLRTRMSVQNILAFFRKQHFRLLEDCLRFRYSKTYISILSLTWNIPSSFQKLEARKFREANIKLKFLLTSILNQQFFCNLRLVIRDNASSLRLTETSGTRILFELKPV